MATDANAAESGALSIDQAVGVLDAAEKKRDDAPAEAVETPAEPDSAAEPTAEEASEPETATDGEEAETEETEAEGEEPEQAPIDPPKFWDAEAKKRFGELPRDLQELVLAKEVERDKATSKAMQDAAEKRKTADGEASRIAQLNGVLDKLVPQAIETFQSRWSGFDLEKVVAEQGADAALTLKAQMDKELVIVQQLQDAKDEAEQVQFAKFVETESAKLPDLAPELADTKLSPDGKTTLGDQRKSELGKFLIGTGVPTFAIRNMTANETSIAYDAMRWRQAQAKAKVQASAPSPQPKPAAQPNRSVRPTASATSRPPQSARLQELNRKRSLTVDEAVERLNLMEPQT